jgi:hypothetical protein
LKLRANIQKRMKFLLKLQGHLQRGIKHKESEITGQEAAMAVPTFVPCRFMYYHKNFGDRFYDKLPIDRTQIGHLGYHVYQKCLTVKRRPIKVLVRQTQKLHRTLDDPGGYISLLGSWARTAPSGRSCSFVCWTCRWQVAPLLIDIAIQMERIGISVFTATGSVQSFGFVAAIT